MFTTSIFETFIRLRLFTNAVSVSDEDSQLHLHIIPVDPPNFQAMIAEIAISDTVIYIFKKTT